jgi:glycosyltransferase involved in cell wall biosynthesis
MKILWLAPFPYIDDSSHPAPWITSLAKALIDNGVELTILNYNSTIEKDIIKKDFQGIKLIYLKTPSIKKDLLTLYMLRIKIVKSYLQKIEKEYDLLHIHGSEHQYEAMAYGLNIPIVISIQGIITEVIKEISLVSDFKKFMIWKLSSFYEKRYLPKYKNFSCRTHWDSGYIKSINSEAKIYMIWEIIRDDFFQDHFSDEKKNILFVGGKNSIKGLVELLQAYNNSLQNKDLKLIILGNCSQSDILDIIKKYDLHQIKIKNIDCRGLQDVSGMLKAYEESFCLIHPTYIDNSPNSVCEAQLSGLPVIATDVGGVASLIENGETGLLIGQNSEDIELSVDKLLNDDSLRKYISEKSRQLSRHRHKSELIVEQTINMYNDILSDSQ